MATKKTSSKKRPIRRSAVPSTTGPGDATITDPAPGGSPTPGTGTVGAPSGSGTVTVVQASAANDDDVTLAASLPAPNVSHVREISRGIIDLCASPATQQMLQTYKTELSTVVGLDAASFTATVTQAQQYADAYGRFAESLDRVGFATVNASKLVHQGAELIAKAAKSAAPGSDFYLATQGFLVQRQALLGSRKRIATLRKNSKAQAAAAAPTAGTSPATPPTPTGTGNIT